MTNLVQLLSGRKHESGIWDYFTYNKDTDKSECKVIVKNDKVCGKLVAGKNATNLKAHVRAVAALTTPHRPTFCLMTARLKQLIPLSKKWKRGGLPLNLPLEPTS